MKTVWRLKKHDEQKEKVLKNFMSNPPDLLVKLLINRGIDSFEQAQYFFYPTRNYLKDPELLSGVKEATDIIIGAMCSGKRIVVHGDYDVDGITSMAVLALGMKVLGVDIVCYVPERENGYGLNMASINSISVSRCDVLITVDCGITAVKEIERAKELGMTVILTDHHDIPDGDIPKADVIVNPKMGGKYKFKELAGVGTIWMVVLNILKKYRMESYAYGLLDIVAIGTIADVMPLIDDNRIIVNEGLSVLKHTNKPGLKALKNILFENPDTRDLSSTDVGFKIGPCLNAAGRMGKASEALALFLASDEVSAVSIANSLINKNEERKKIEKEMVAMAEEIIQSKPGMSAVFVNSPLFHHGVVGIVASKLVDKYHKPAFILQDKPNGMSSASVRGIPGYNVLEAVKLASHLMYKFGGHEGAAGFSCKTENLPEVERIINDYTYDFIKTYKPIKYLEIDTLIGIGEVSMTTVNSISSLKPFGNHNPEPVFAIKNHQVANAKYIGQGNVHIMFDIVKDGETIKRAVWFSATKTLEFFSNHNSYSTAFTLESNEFRGETSAKAMVKDVKLTEDVEI